jgi:hypothetical protein
MTRSEWKERLPIIQAFIEQKCVQYRISEADDWIVLEYAAFDRPGEYRIKPEPKLRPWKPEEVPVGAILRDNGREFEILGVCEKFSAIKCPAVILSVIDGVCFPRGHYFLKDLVTSITKPQHSTDGGKTWKPCGVEE